MTINNTFAEEQVQIKHRNTIQRIKILGFLKKNRNHPTAEMIYKEVSKDIPTITLATVYRNLNTMTEQGEVLRFEVNKEYRYDAYTKCHQHCVCKNCGKIIDYYDETIMEGCIKKIQKSINDKIKSIDINLTIICEDCAKA